MNVDKTITVKKYNESEEKRIADLIQMNMNRKHFWSSKWVCSLRFVSNILRQDENTTYDEITVEYIWDKKPSREEIESSAREILAMMKENK